MPRGWMEWAPYVPVAERRRRAEKLIAKLRKQGKTLAATSAAFGLIDAVPRAIADPGTTAIWEQALDMVQSGEMPLDEFVAKQSAWMSKQIEHCRGLQLTISGPPPGGRPAWKGKRKGASRKKAAPAKKTAAKSASGAKKTDT